MTQLSIEIQRFHEWANACPARHGAWECDYPDWNALYASAIALIESSSDGSLEPRSLLDLLFVLARDNECEHLIDSVANHPGLLQTLATHAVDSDEPDAKWQVAVAVGETRLPNAADLIRPFLSDDDEYVRRRSLIAFAPFAPSEAEAIAAENLNDRYPYTRIAALNVLKLIKSSRLHDALDRLKADPNEHVRSYANDLLSSQSGD